MSVRQIRLSTVFLLGSAIFLVLSPASVAANSQEGFLWLKLSQAKSFTHINFLVFMIGLATYILILFLFRHIYIVKPELRALSAARQSLETLAKDYSDEQDTGSKHQKRVLDLLNQSKGLLSDKEGIWRAVIPRWDASARFCGAWQLLHEAEREFAQSQKHATPCRAASVFLRLKASRIQDKDLKVVEQKLADFIKKPDEQHATTITPWVQQAEALLCREQQLKIQATQEARNKALWLIVSAFACVFWLGLLVTNSIALLLAGAIGGLLSRLSAAVKFKGKTFDYTVSWMVLFLTPLVGAIMGWFGVAFTELAVEMIEVANPGEISLTKPNGLAFLVAFLFGWSARLFDAAANKLESEFTRTLEEGGFAKGVGGPDQSAAQP